MPPTSQEHRKPLVTVGLPVYNGERYLQEALDSILSQSFADLEVIVSDNASTDSTVDIARRAADGDRRVRLIRQPRNLGAAANYNQLVSLARGKLFRWAAHDDVLAPTLIERLVRALKESGPRAVLAFSDTTVIDENGDVIEDWVYEDPWSGATPSSRLRSLLLRKNSYHRHCYPVFGLIRTDALRTTGLIRGYAASDKVLLVELALRGDFILIQEPLFRRRDHPDASLRANTEADVTAWFDPSAAAARRPSGMTTRLFGAYLGVVARSRLPLVERARCGETVFRWLQVRRDQTPNWRVMGGEIRRQIAWRVRSRSGASQS